MVFTLRSDQYMCVFFFSGFFAHIRLSISVRMSLPPGCPVSMQAWLDYEWLNMTDSDLTNCFDYLASWCLSSARCIA